MRKLIAAINMTLDGVCDHTVMIPDDEIHQHYSELLKNTDTLVYGRITYQLMENFWPTVVRNPTGNRSIDEFAVLMDDISKVVFSRTLKNVEWKNSRVAKGSIEAELSELKQQPGRDIVAGSPSLIISLMKLDLVDEYQICVLPIIAGKGLRLFKDFSGRQDLKLLKIKTFHSGSTTLYYEPKKR